MQTSLERINPDLVADQEITGKQTLQFHLQRYHYAGRNLVRGTTADIACGVGYGSYLLATEYGENIEKIIGVDNDRGSIEFARSRYRHNLIQFAQEDALYFQSPFPLANIISLETIEHLPQPERFVKQMSQQLLKGGHFIASVPITPSMDANPYHLHDFTKDAFLKIFTDAGLRLVDSIMQVQHYKPFSIMGKKEVRSKGLRRNIMWYYLQNPGKFFLRLRSLVRDGFNNKYLVAVFEKL